jgi:aminoglycoside 6'-N-acetyltransferase I
VRLRREFHRLIVRPATADDRQAWAAIRALLWPEEGAAGHAAELAALAGDPQFAGFVADDEGLLIGFAEATVRSYAEGCGDEPAAYLEGIWVAPGHRRKGVGRALLEAVETWGRARGHR